MIPPPATKLFLRPLLSRSSTAAALQTTARSISSAKLTVRLHPDSESKFSRMPKKEELKFGKTFSDHMLQIPYKKSSGGWQDPMIVPYGDLTISPAASSLHYGEIPVSERFPRGFRFPPDESVSFPLRVVVTRCACDQAWNVLKVRTGRNHIEPPPPPMTSLFLSLSLALIISSFRLVILPSFEQFCRNTLVLAQYSGMKAYKSLTDDSLRLFRPDKNMERLRNSMERLSMPGYDFNPHELINCIAELVRVGKFHFMWCVSFVILHLRPFADSMYCHTLHSSIHQFIRPLIDSSTYNVNLFNYTTKKRHCDTNNPDTKHKHTMMNTTTKTDRDWIPSGEGYSLYLRPTVISTHPYLGVATPDDLLLYVITSPVGPYYTSGFNPVRLTADSEYVRAWPGGTGGSKVGGNYAPTMKPAGEAAERGYSQILWVFGENHEITEVGAMNVFFFLETKGGGGRELVTPPLTRGDILPGVTRKSILELAESWGEFDVVERSITMPEIAEAAAEGRLIESFGAGTAAVVTPIEAIQFRGKDIEIPATGELTKRFFSDLMGIQYGRIEGPEGWSVKI
ncbi:hypothetical protein ACHAXS_005042 [Conticribra weissflogii]